VKPILASLFARDRPLSRRTTTSTSTSGDGAAKSASDESCAGAVTIRLSRTPLVRSGSGVRERESGGGGEVVSMGADLMLVNVAAEEGCSKDGTRTRGGEWTSGRSARSSGYT
jgi:hypothetical protein